MNVTMPPVGAAAGEFQGTSRFRLVRRIGAGGMGVVYEAEDLERGQRVALKTIRHPGSDTVYRLKREFRALADLSHPNLAALYDLVVDDARCFFTMELVYGQDFLSFVGHSPRPEDGGLAFAETISTGDLEREVDTLAPVPVPAPVAATGTPAQPTRAARSGPHLLAPATGLACDEARLRAVLPQLGQGLNALHTAGKVHRDIKPSNIMITRKGRVVLLDFGLVAEIEPIEARPTGSSSGNVVGTVGYMAPEQAGGESRLTGAADWYSVGALVYQALTGRLPFTGPSLRVLMDKQTHSPRPPRALVPQVPRDLDELCVELLARDPRERPTGMAALRRVGAPVEERGASRPTTLPDNQFAGRGAELGKLEQAFTSITSGQAAAVLVSGASGIGKSALIAHWLGEVRRRRPETVVLAGRCYERESVPYKAMDSLIDHLSSHWMQLAPVDAQALLPRDAALLPTLFPVLGRVPAVADAPRGKTVVDPQETRTRAWSALRQVLQRMADRHPLVLFIDDLQWVDGDTVNLLADLMRAPDPPGLLLLLSARREGAETAEALVRRMDVDRQVIEVGPLGAEDAAALAAAHLAGGPPELAERIAREAAGSPFFLLELTRYLQGRDSSEALGKGLDEVLAERFGELPEDARTALEVIAVAGEPVTLRVAGAAAGLPGDEVPRQIRHLRTQRFVRAVGGRADDLVEPYHDRIRESLLGRLAPDRLRRHHRAIAVALTGQASAERLARHWRGAGEGDRAAEYARRAAEEATATLDFDRAAELYRLALELGTYTPEARQKLRTALGHALGRAGRPVEASSEFALAAQESDATTALELRRRAADALLRGGYMAEGLEATRLVLSQLGMRLARTPGRALASMLLRRAWLWLRGLGWRRRDLGQIPQLELTRVDVCEGVALGLANVDVFRSADFCTRFILAALRLGEPSRVVRAIALEADLLAVQARTRRATKLLANLEALVAEHPTPQATSVLYTTQGLIDFGCHNRWRSAHERLSEAMSLYLAHESAIDFELNTVDMFRCMALDQLGDWPELSRRLPALVEAAIRRGDRYASVIFRVVFATPWLMRDDAAEGEAQVSAAIDEWGAARDHYQLQHMFALVSRCNLALYQGDAARAQALLRAEEPQLRRSLLHLAPSNRLLLEQLRGRIQAAVAASPTASAPERKRAAAGARATARWLRRTPHPAGRAVARLVEGSAARALGDDARCASEWAGAERELDGLEMAIWAASVRWQRGKLLGGGEGAELCARAEAEMAARDVARPDRLAVAMVPGVAPGGAA